MGRHLAVPRISSSIHFNTYSSSVCCGRRCGAAPFLGLASTFTKLYKRSWEDSCRWRYSGWIRNSVYVEAKRPRSSAHIPSTNFVIADVVAGGVKEEKICVILSHTLSLTHTLTHYLSICLCLLLSLSPFLSLSFSFYVSNFNRNR